MHRRFTAKMQHEFSAKVHHRDGVTLRDVEILSPRGWGESIVAYRREPVLEIAEVVRLVRAGASDRRIVELLGLNRRTVAKYRSWAQEQGLVEGELPPARTLQEVLDRTLPKAIPPQQSSTVGAYRDEIARMRERGMEIAAIRSRLEE